MVRATSAVRLLAGDKEPVRVASTANLALAGLLAVDGIVLVAGDRVLVKDQSDATENGIYVASEGTWHRSADANSSRSITKGMNTFVQEGSVNAGSVYVADVIDPDLGDDDITFTLGPSLAAFEDAVSQAETFALAAQSVSDAFARVATLAALKALDTTQVTTAYLTLEGSEGIYNWRTGDYTARIAADPAGRNYVKADAIASSAGAWVRPGGDIAVSYPGGRLTLATGIAVMTSTVSGATSVIYTPCMGNLMPMYDGANFVSSAFSELSQATTDNTKSPAACTTNSNYDLFVWSDSGTVRCTRGPAWSSNTVRGTGAGTTELEMLNGIYVNKNAITNGPAARRGTYVGTIRTNGSSTVDYIMGGSGSGGVAVSLGVWNMYNRNLAVATCIDNGTPYNYTTATIRQARASATNQVSFVVGVPSDAVNVSLHTRIDTAATAGAFGTVGIGEDTTTLFTSPKAYGQTDSAALSLVTVATSLKKVPLYGYHVYSSNETGDGSAANGFCKDSDNRLTVEVWN